MVVLFEWDKNKARGNQKKHQVSFTEAATLFRDPLAVIFDDEEHSNSESREIIIGHSEQGKLLLVSFTERNGLIRIISARKATPLERQEYESREQ